MVHDTTDADALGSNPIMLDGKVLGRCTSGNYGFRIEKSLALAMIDPAVNKVGIELTIEILGTEHRCTIVGEALTVQRTRNCA